MVKLIQKPTFCLKMCVYSFLGFVCYDTNKIKQMKSTFNYNNNLSHFNTFILYFRWNY